MYANNAFIKTLTNREIVCGIASEEEDNFITIKGRNEQNDNNMWCWIDPLDGSSNIDVNVSVGDHFSIYRRITEPEPGDARGFPATRENQVAAGYIIYGTSTMIVYTTGHGVNGFTLNPAIGTYYLSHPNMKFPEDGKFIGKMREIMHFLQGEGLHQILSERRGRLSLLHFPIHWFVVSDFHRNMIKGGIYIYPNTAKDPNGKSSVVVHEVTLWHLLLNKREVKL